MNQSLSKEWNGEKMETINEVHDDRQKHYRAYYVGCLVLTHDKKILLQQRGHTWNRYPGYLSEFGGEIEDAERPIDALMRELGEELGALVDERDIVPIGMITEAITNHQELLYLYFWWDRGHTMTGCYEGEARVFENIDEIYQYPKVMDSTQWLLKACERKGILPKLE